MPALLDDLHFAFQPLVNINTSGVVAVEALARPAQGDVRELFQAAANARRLPELDIELAVLATQFSAEHETLLPLHLNLFAETVISDPVGLDALFGALRATGRRPRDVVLEISGPLSHLDLDLLLSRLDRLRATGCRIALDGFGGGDTPMTFVVEAGPDLVKLDQTVLIGLPDDPKRVGLLEGLVHCCRHAGSTVVATGVQTKEQLLVLRRTGVHLMQGKLFASPSRRPMSRIELKPELTDLTDTDAPKLSAYSAGPRITDFLCPAMMLPVKATADQVRGVLAARPEVTSVMLVDEAGVPQWTIDRNRFLLAVTGPYGHALHAKRAASRLADEPRMVGTDATAMQTLHMMSGSGSDRMYDDIVVVDESGRCLGVVRLADLFRGMAEMKVQEAAALNPLTRLPGADAIGKEVHRRISAGEIFAMSWVDVDGFKLVNDRSGFAAGDDLIRAVGRNLTDVAAALRSVSVGHVGGDDFLALVDLDDLVALATAVLDVDRAVDGIPVTLSMATLVCAPGSVSDYRQVSRLLAPLKQQAKSLHGSSWVLGRPGSSRTDVLRGQRPPQLPPQGGAPPPQPAPHDNQVMQRTG